MQRPISAKVKIDVVPELLKRELDFFIDFHFLRVPCLKSNFGMGLLPSFLMIKIQKFSTDKTLTEVSSNIPFAGGFLEFRFTANEVLIKKMFCRDLNIDQMKHCEQCGKNKENQDGQNQSSLDQRLPPFSRFHHSYLRFYSQRHQSLA